MPFIRTLIGLVIAALTNAQCEAADVPDAYALQTYLGMIEAWRLAPEAVLRYCRRIDADGNAERIARFDAWNHAHAALRADIERRFNRLVPLVPLPHSEGNPVEAAREKVILETLRMTFRDKSDSEAFAYCRSYVRRDFQLWSEQRIDRVRTSISALDAWEAGLPMKPSYNPSLQRTAAPSAEL